MREYLCLSFMLVCSNLAVRHVDKWQPFNVLHRYLLVVVVLLR